MAEPKLTYGLDENHTLIHVDKARKGKECKCTCPHCDVKLVARQGDRNRWHFAHDNGADCGKARMTALHMLAQQIIQEEKKIRKPWFKDYHKDPSKEIYYFESVLLEQRFKTTEINRRPDCVGIIKNGDKQYEVWIEVKVKHAIDDDKRNDIIRLGAICMEIDISGLLTERYTENSVRKALFDVYNNKEWVNHPALFKKNEEERIKKEESEAFQQLKEQEEREELEELVDGWMNCGLIGDAEKIIEKIEFDPYNQITNSKYKIIDFLIPEYDILKWLEISPRNTYTKKLFYIILKYYTRQLYDNVDRKLVDERLNSFRFKQSITEEEKQELELLLSLKIVSSLRYAYHPYPYVYYFDEKKELYKKFISDEVFRNKCLKLLSTEYRHILGSESKDFLTLTEEIRRFYPCILPLYIAILEYTYTTKRPKFNIPKLEEESIVEARKIVDTLTVDEDCYQLFESVFGYLIKNSTFKRQKVVQSARNDIPDTQTQLKL